MLFKIALPRAPFNASNCFSMSPATRNENKDICAINKYRKILRKKAKLKMLKIVFLE